MRDALLAPVRDALATIGYPTANVVSDYEFTTRNGSVRRWRVDMAAFGESRRHDLQTSCIAATVLDGYAPQDAIESFRFLAVPVGLLVHLDGVIDLVSPHASGHANLAVDLEPSALHKFFQAHRSDLGPRSLTSAKRGTRQLSLFDLDRSLVELAEEATRKLLVERVSGALALLNEAPGTADDVRIELLLQLLTASIVADKEVWGPSTPHTAAEILGRSASLYPGSFDPRLAAAVTPGLADDALEALRNGVSYRACTTDMLGYLYENAFVDEETRRAYGIYYTPRHIADRILKRLPVEEIPPERRVVLDGTCGSGSLLLASLLRLRELVPDDEEIQPYLHRSIHGVDSDAFASRLCQRSLFLGNLPDGNGWDVRHADFMTLEPKMDTVKPTIVVANPPFLGTRSAVRRSREKAAEILVRYLQWLPPGGLLGIVLPETILHTHSSSEARQALLADAEVLEVWSLPEGLFPQSDVATIALLARRRGATPPQQAVRVDRIGGPSKVRREFERTGRATHTFYLEPPSPDATPLLSMIDPELYALHKADGRTLGDVANVINGINLGPEAKDLVHSHEVPGSLPWIGSAAALSPYEVHWGHAWLENVPQRMERSRQSQIPMIRQQPKVIMNSGRSTKTPWRIIAAVDRSGFVVSHSMYAVVPKGSDYPAEVLAAVLNNPLVNAWVDARNRTRWLGSTTIEQIPLPVLPTADVERIVALLNSPDASLVDAAVQIDGLILDGYGISRDRRQRIARFFQPYPRPGGLRPPVPEQDVEELGPRLSSMLGRHMASVRSEHREAAGTRGKTETALRLLAAQVIRVNTGARTIVVDLLDFDPDVQSRRELELDVPWPGWALRPDAQVNLTVQSPIHYASELESAEIIAASPAELPYLDIDGLVPLLQDNESA